MIKKIYIIIFGSVIVNICMIIGIMLLVVALYLGINPADGSAVNPLVRETWISLFLFITTIPAMAAMLIAGDGIVGFALMFSIQACVFWTLGKIMVLLSSSITQHKKNGS